MTEMCLIHFIMLFFPTPPPVSYISLGTLFLYLTIKVGDKIKYRKTTGKITVFFSFFVYCFKLASED